MQGALDAAHLLNQAPEMPLNISLIWHITGHFMGYSDLAGSATTAGTLLNQRAS